MKVKTLDDVKTAQDLQITAKIMQKYRQKANLSISKVAMDMGISAAALAKYESGTRHIQLGLWLRWCDAVGIKHRSAAERIAIACGYDQMNRFRSRKKKCPEQN